MVNGTRQWVLLIVGTLILVFPFCSPRDDERALRELVEKAARFAEKHDMAEIMDLTTEDFRARTGNFDRRGAKRILFMAFRHYNKLRVFHPQPSVELESEAGGASVSVPFLIAKKDQSLPELKELYRDPMGWIERVGESGDLYRFKLKTVKVKGNWLVKRANLEKFTGMGFSK